MCMACEEMELYYAYLDALEEEKRKAQPWQCEVTVIPQGDERRRRARGTGRGAGEGRQDPAKPGFVCDEPE